MTTTNTTTAIPTPMDLFNKMTEQQVAAMGFVQQEWQKVAQIGQDYTTANMELGARLVQNSITTSNAVVAEWNKIGQETVKRTVEAFEAVRPAKV